MKFYHILLLSCLAGLSTALSAEARVAHLASPDGAIRLTVSDGDGALPTYTVTVDGDTVLAPSPFALSLDGVKDATRIKKVNTRTGLTEHIEAPFYRQSEFDVNYNLMNVTMDNGVTVEWRTFNDGIAYRYKTALRDTAMIVTGETVSFNTVGDPTVYLSHSTNKEKPMAMAFQNQYSVTPISHAGESLSFLPATIDTGNGVKLTILESDVESYPGMFLKADTADRSLYGRFAPYPKACGYYPWRHQSYVTETEDYIARTNGTRTFPWRVIAITRRDIDMPVNNLVYALASPSRIDDISPVKPGKVAWEWWNDWGLAGVPFKAGINTDTYKYYIDFASKNGIEYIVLDEGWYNPESGDMLTVIDDIDLGELIEYGRAKNVGIVLWTVFNVLDSQLEEACELYSKMGVKGFKVDFLDRNDQTAAEMTYRIADAAARHHLSLDLHGFYTPTGLNRTYPNILNFESVFGMEEMKWSEPTVDMPRYDVTFPYIRMMAGPVDYTPGAMTNATRRDWRAHYYNPMSQGTRCHQLATYIVHDSPFTMLADSPTNYGREQECVSFITSIPTVFEETRVIDGKLGEYIISARRNGSAWYVGGMTDWTPRDITVDMSFLPAGRDYLATVFTDGINAEKQGEDYQVETLRVNSDTCLPVSMASGGGFAMTLSPLSDDGPANAAAAPADMPHRYGKDADVAYNTPGAMNPFIPGYFADPTVKKFGDTFYVYATTDGSGAGFGPAQLWTSKDFVNWTLMPMNWPDSHWIWAPDVMLNENDGRYYYIYCQPCQIHVGVGDTPRGPWQNILGESEAVLVPDRFVTGAITLDGQTFVDDDGSIYMYWGTWGIYDGFGCGSGRLNPDMKGFAETRLIPNTEATKFFEAPFVMKRDSTYYFMYSSDSCHDSTYHVQYATARSPLGPYTYRGAILRSNADGTVHGPGHHSVLSMNDDEHYIVYHRHDNPHSNRGFHRQLCIDRMEFDDDGSIKVIEPTHKGVGALAPLRVQSPNIAFGAGVKASSYYDNDFIPEYAVDDNNGTLWRPAGMGQEWIELDFGKIKNIKTVWTQWEYGTQFYRYLIETSADGKNWEIFADKRSNRLAGSPMVDFGDTEAQYLRITFTGGQKAGFGGAIWNIKVYETVEDSCPQQWLGLTGSDWDGQSWNNNEGQLGGSFVLEKGRARQVRVDGHDGHDAHDALMLEPGTVLVFNNKHVSPDKPHTISAIEYIGNEWKPASMETSLTDGKITISAGAKERVIANLRYYNWELLPAERAFDSQADILRMPVAGRVPHGLLVDISADMFQPGDTVGYIPNGKGIDGYYATDTGPVVVEDIKGRKGFRFDGTHFFTSSFPLPATVRDNAPYTLEAVILNPTIELNECYADFTTTHDELEKIMGVNGTEPRCGVMQHYGWYEDAGWADVKSLENEWQHIYVAFDGRIERVYINGKLISEKDIQLLVKPVQYVTLGRNAEHEWPFTGYINSIRFSDEYIPFQHDIKQTIK